MTYAYRPSSRWTGQHQMSMNSKRGDFTLTDFDAAGRTAALPRGRARRIVQDVTDVVADWNSYAEAANVPEHLQAAITPTLNIHFSPAR
jgi:serine/threonine-protein kinase HipA